MTQDKGERVLKPCPFCGGDDVLTSGPYGFYRHWCISHFCVSYPSGSSCLMQGFSSEDAAIAAWNTRIAKTEPPAAEGEVRQAINEVLSRWDELDAGSPAAQGCANRLACLVANNRDLVLAALAARTIEVEADVFTDLAARQEPLGPEFRAAMANIESLYETEPLECAPGYHRCPPERTTETEAVTALREEQPLCQPVADRIYLMDLDGCGEITWCDDPDPSGENDVAVEYVRVAVWRKPVVENDHG